ncbi:MAG TPA: hypothetical protein VK760_07625, partial [Candidatus Acidoferrales bacterium]|nr:hypothetical protein [Candidatus Acidoferrales bacterium]
GKLWFATSGDTTVRTITTAGTIASVTTIPWKTGLPSELAAGPDGNVWFETCAGVNAGVADEAFGYISPATGNKTTLYSGRVNHGDIRDIVPGPDGNMWFLADGGIERVTEGNMLSVFPVGVNQPVGMVSKGKNLWFIGQFPPSLNEIGTDGTPMHTFTPSPASTVPLSLIVGADGNFYFIDFSANTDVVEMTPTGAELRFPTSGTPERLVLGPDGAIWVAGVGTLGRLSIVGNVGTWTQYSIPNAGNDIINSIVVGPDGAFWMAGSSNKIWRAAL